MLDQARIRVPRLQGSWRGERLEDEVDVRLTQLAALLPTFARVPLGRNRLKDLIVRVEDDLPVDTVSKKYRLIQHFEVVEAFAETVEPLGSTRPACARTSRSPSTAPGWRCVSSCRSSMR